MQGKGFEPLNSQREQIAQTRTFLESAAFGQASLPLHFGDTKARHSGTDPVKAAFRRPETGIKLTYFMRIEEYSGLNSFLGSPAYLFFPVSAKYKEVEKYGKSNRTKRVRGLRL